MKQDEKLTIGSYLLEIITTGLYTSKLDVIREYIQNSLDSINQCKKKNNDTDFEINITIQSKQKTLKIHDNGTGIPVIDATGKFLNIGVSSKSIDEDAGFRGIGRLAGIAYCERLIFRTSAIGEIEESIIEFDCKKIKKDIRTTSRKNTELSDLILACTNLSSDIANKESHYFIVEMIGIDYDSDFLKSSRIEDYIKVNGPVEYGPKFRSYIPLLNSHLSKLNINLDNVSINLRSDEFDSVFSRKITRPLKTHYKTVKKNVNNGDVEIEGINFIEDGRSINAPRYWGWYTKNELSGVIDDDLSGIRFRKKNIQVGDLEISNSLFSGKTEFRLNRWVIGEIHILDPAVIPNSRRDDFEETPEWIQIKEDLKPFIKQLARNCHKATDNRNKPIPRFKSEMKKMKSEFQSFMNDGFISETERSAWNKKMSTSEDKLKKLEQKFNKSSDYEAKEYIKKAKEELTSMKSDINNHKLIKTRHFSSKLTKNESKLINKVIRIVADVINDVNCPNSKECMTKINEALEEEFK